MARYNHASITLESVVYVVAGFGGKKRLDTIEMLSMAPQARSDPDYKWQLFKPAGLTPRKLPAVCPISHTKFVIMGGSGDEDLLSDAIIVDTKTR